MNDELRHKERPVRPKVALLRRAMSARRFAALRQCCKYDRLADHSFWIFTPVALIGMLALIFGMIAVIGAIDRRFNLSPSTEVMLAMIGNAMAVVPILISSVGEADHQCQMMFARMRNLHGRPYYCHQCGYDLRCSRTPSCPECGWEIVMGDKQPRERWRVIRGRRIAGNIMLGMVFLVVGAVAWMLWMMFTQ